MTHHEAQTGTRDVTYNLISVIYHALQGAETYAMYAQDAEQAGDNESASFFREIIEEERRRADRGKQMLRQKLAEGSSR